MMSGTSEQHVGLFSDKSAKTIVCSLTVATKRCPNTEISRSLEAAMAELTPCTHLHLTNQSSPDSGIFSSDGLNKTEGKGNKSGDWIVEHRGSVEFDFGEIFKEESDPQLTKELSEEKRGRGRPRKRIQSDPPLTKGLPEPKRGRGRPRNRIQSDSPNNNGSIVEIDGERIESTPLPVAASEEKNTIHGRRLFHSKRKVLSQKSWRKCDICGTNQWMSPRIYRQHYIRCHAPICKICHKLCESSFSLFHHWEISHLPYKLLCDRPPGQAWSPVLQNCKSPLFHALDLPNAKSVVDNRSFKRSRSLTPKPRQQSKPIQINKFYEWKRQIDSFFGCPMDMKEETKIQQQDDALNAVIFDLFNDVYLPPLGSDVLLPSAGFDEIRSDDFLQSYQPIFMDQHLNS